MIFFYNSGAFPASSVAKVGPLCHTCVELKKAQGSENRGTGARNRYAYLKCFYACFLDHFSNSFFVGLHYYLNQSRMWEYLDLIFGIWKLVTVVC